MNSGTFQPYRTTSDPATGLFRHSGTLLFRRDDASAPVATLGPRSQSIDPPQYILEQFPRPDLGHLEMTYRAPASSKRRCIRLALCCRAELDMETLVWTRGRAFPLSRLESVRSRQSERLKRRNENIQWPPMPSFLSRKFCRWPQPCLEPHCLFFVSTLSG